MKENMRPRGQFPLGIESDVVIAAEDIVRGHAQHNEQRLIDKYKEMNKALDIIMRVGSIILLSGLLLAHEVKERTTEQDSQPSSHTLYSSNPYQEIIGEVFCAVSVPPTNNPELAFKQCSDFQKDLIRKQGDTYSPQLPSSKP